MARTSTHLYFGGNTEEAFTFYASVFGTQPLAPIWRMRDAPAEARLPALSEKEKDYVLHVALPILGGHVLMGVDLLESLGHPLTFGSNISITLEPDTREETDRLFARLSEGGRVETPLQDMFWGDYYGYLTDKFGVRWMLNCAGKKA